MRKDLHSKLVLWGDGATLSSITQELLNEVGDVSTGDGDVLDGRSDDIPLRDGNGV
mgnify:CR=1 FL=1|jgi:hypothetical protein